MILGAEIADQSVGVFAVGALVVGSLGAFAYLIRNAFEGTTKAVEGLGKKLEEISATIAKADGDRRVVESDVKHLTERVARLEAELRELSEVAK